MPGGRVGKADSMPQLKQKGRSSSVAGLRARALRAVRGLSFRTGRQGYFLSHSWPFFFHHRHDSRHQYSVTMKASFS